MQSNESKIVVVTITRIESDIIESFVRHTLTFADEILIYDNGSADGTQDILQELCDEGLPLVVWRETGNVEFNHGERMTELCFMAKKRQASLIIPLDVDEFLVNTENTMPVRELLLQIHSHEIVKIPLVQYQLQEEYHGGSFLPWQECLRVCTTTEKCHFSPKCMLGKDVLQDGVTLVQGCHYVLCQGKMMHDRQLPFLHLAHFHYRSEERYQIKTMLGWLGTVCIYGLYTPVCDYMKTNYRHIMTGDKVYVYQGREPVDEKIDLRSFIAHQDVLYGDLVRINSLEILMEEAQHLAANYAAEKAKARGKKVDIILPFWGDEKALMDSCQQVEKQVYPHCKVWLLNMTAKKVDKICLASFPWEWVEFSTEKDRDMFWSRLNGAYSQWLMPGMKISVRHILQLVATLELNGYVWRLAIQEFRGTGSILDKILPLDNTYSCCEAKVFWQEFASRDWDCTAGLQNVLIPQALLLEVRSYFVEGLANQEVDYRKIWQGLLDHESKDLPDKICLFFSDEEMEAQRHYKRVRRENRRAVSSFTNEAEKNFRKHLSYLDMTR